MQSRRICQSPGHKTDCHTTEVLGENRPIGRSLYPERDPKQPKTNKQKKLWVDIHVPLSNHLQNFVAKTIKQLFYWTHCSSLCCLSFFADFCILWSTKYIFQGYKFEVESNFTCQWFLLPWFPHFYFLGIFGYQGELGWVKRAKKV